MLQIDELWFQSESINELTVKLISLNLRWFTLAQIPQPIHSGSEICATFDSGVTSIHSFPVDTRYILA